MATVEALVQKQIDHKNSIKTAITNMKKLSRDLRTVDTLLKTMVKFDRVYAQMEALNLEISTKATDDQAKTMDYFVNSFMTGAKDLYGEGLDFIRKELTEKSKPDPTPAPAPAPAGMSDETGKELVKVLKNMNTQKKSVKIKSLEIPMFSGDDIREYTSFKSLCKTALDGSEYGSQQKLGYLKTRLKGKALNVIKHLELLDNNYAEAWRLLDIRYGDKSAQTDAELKALQELQPIRGTRYLGDYRKVIDMAREVIANLKLLGQNIHDNDVQLFKTIRDKLDYKSRVDYDEKSVGTPVSIENLLTFLENRYKIHENLSSSSSANNNNNNNYNKNQKAFLTDRNRKGCLVCQSKDHKTTRCPTLANADDPRKLLFEKSICISCGSHPYSRNTKCQVREKLNCEVCHDKHLTSLHRANKREKNLVSITDNAKQNIILPSIRAYVSGKHGLLEATGLADSCSTASYISEKLAKKLKLPRQNYNDSVSGLGGVTVASIKSKVKVTLCSIYDTNVTLTIDALVCDHVASAGDNQPSLRDPLLKNLQLADPYFDSGSRIEFLLGAEGLCKILMPSTQKIGNLIAQKTTFGHILSGAIPRKRNNKCLITLNEIDKNIRECWKMPDLASTADETAFCDRVFEEETTVDDKGSFCVPLFVKPDAPKLGQSYDKCAAIFISQEKSVIKNPQKKKMSDDFMEDYLTAGHMREAEPQEDPSSLSEVLGTYYAPYHSIFKMDKLTTKVRNVFNFSSKSSNNVSLNEMLYIGPNLLVNLLAILITFRVFPIAFTADISMMYRTINLLPKYWDLQRIVWRKNPLDPLKIYKLTTVTYGVACSPALALMVLERIAKQAAEPIYEWMSKRFYMDDYIFGSFSPEIGQNIVTSVHQELKKSNMQLRKFASNNPEILQNIPPEDRIENFLTEKDKTITVLGYKWNLTNDTLQVSIPDIKDTVKHTKRTLLSAVASLYDPIGLLLPVVVLLRLLLQKVWNKKYDWDDTVDQDLVSEFRNIFQEFPLLKDITFPRWIHSLAETGIELLGFADASKDAIACVIYARVKKANEYKTSLICAKSHLTPLHVKFSKGFNTGNFTTPKLELSALNLLADLMEQVIQSLTRDIKINDCHAFTDSEVVLNWLHHSISENTISNKVIKRHTKSILKVFEIEKIHHVRTAFNPSDSASRGLNPKDLKENQNWFNGPHLCQQTDFPKFEKAKPKEQISLLTSNNANEFAETLLTRHSIFSMLVRLVARILRWKYKAEGIITSLELSRAEKYIIRLQQSLSFPEEIKNLKNKQPLPIRSRIRTLQPFLDEDNLLRVGGRAEHDHSLTYDEKHPYLLDSNSILAIPLIRRAHLTLGHGENKLVRRELRNKFWLLTCKEKIKAFIKRCPTCIRSKKQFPDPPIGQLPADRLKPATPFSVAGVDFCGPFSCKASNLRGVRSFPSYVAVFICFFTRAIHLELCSDLTAECFLQCFNRFANRRGTPTRLYSDNGRNFVGASNILKNRIRSISNEFRSQVTNVEWKFNVPLAPDMAGLWEAAVKSFKKSLRKIVNPTVILSYEELNTILTHCEAILNSRPLSEIYEDNGEPLPLTPFHFLIHRNFAPIPPDDKILNNSMSVTRRWKFVEKLNQELWKKWFDEIFPTLQRVPKYAKRLANLKLNDLVILKDSTPSTLWPIGRVMKLYPGIDGIVRVIDIKTKTGTYKRKINHVLPLTPEDEQIVTIDNSNIPKTVVNSKLDSKKGNTCKAKKDNPNSNQKQTKASHSLPIIPSNQPRLTRGQAKLQGISPQALITLLLISYGQLTGAMDAQSNLFGISEEDHTLFNALLGPEKLVAEKSNELSLKDETIWIINITMWAILAVLFISYLIWDLHKAKRNATGRFNYFAWAFPFLQPKRRPIQIKHVNSDLIEQPIENNTKESHYVNVAQEFLEWELEVPIEGTSSVGEDV